METTLINMQQTTEEAKEYSEPKPADTPKYPWGLCITLNDDSLEKLGIDKLPAAETEVTIIAKAVVSSISEYQTQGGEAQRTMELQITDMQLSGIEKDLATKAADLYSKK